MRSNRNYDFEYQDTEKHKYAYKFDEVLRRFMFREFEPFMIGNKALELGCFEGDFTKYISKRFTEVCVVDASSELISIAKAKLQAEATYIVSTFEELELENKYDAIFMIHTLEHLDSPVEVLAKCKEWLTPEGKLFIAVPNALAPSRQIAVKMGVLETCSSITSDEKRQGHRITYSLDVLNFHLKSAGLNCLKTGGIFFKPLANFQLDLAIEKEIIDEKFLEGCYELGMHYPELCSSIYTVATL